MSADQAAARLREDGPLHYFDCDRFEVYDHGARQGDCDCTATSDIAAVLNERDRLIACVWRAHALCEEARFYVDPPATWEGPNLPPTARLILVADLRRALDPEATP